MNIQIFGTKKSFDTKKGTETHRSFDPTEPI